VSARYRLPLKYPYPTGVDDSVDAILYLCMYAEELGIGSKRMQAVGSRSEDTCLSLSIKSERLPESDGRGPEDSTSAASRGCVVKLQTL
jgi:hypothetical protein